MLVKRVKTMLILEMLVLEVTFLVLVLKRLREFDDAIMLSKEAKNIAQKFGSSQPCIHFVPSSLETRVRESILAYADSDFVTGTNIIAPAKTRIILGDFIFVDLDKGQVHNYKSRRRRILFKNLTEVGGPLNHMLSRSKKKKNLKFKRRSKEDPGIVAGLIMSLVPLSNSIVSCEPRTCLPVPGPASGLTVQPTVPSNVVIISEQESSSETVCYREHSAELNILICNQKILGNFGLNSGENYGRRLKM